MASFNIHTEVPFLNRHWSSIIYVLQSFFPESSLLENMRQKNTLMITRTLKKRLAKKGLTQGGTIEVDRRENLSKEDFAKYYLNRHLPVIFSNQAKDWPCTSKWNLEFLKDKMANVPISMYESAGLIEKEYDQTHGVQEPIIIEETTGKNLAESLQAGSNKYLRFSSIMETETYLIDDLDHTWLRKMRHCFMGVGYQTFIGAAKRVTPIHAGSTAFFYVMADGEKKWTLFSASSSALLNPTPSGRVYNFTDVDINNPDLKKYPGFDLLTRYNCHLKKGDILFVPTWTWHEVENLTPSWGLSYRITSIRGFLRYPQYVMVRIFLAKPSFFKMLWASVMSRKTTKDETSLITPSMIKD